MSLKQAFNAITRLHSRSATFKRPGTPDIFSPVRITPSNYFRYLEGPGNTVIHGREFVIPIDTLKGHYTQLITFSAAPTSGGFILSYDGDDSAVIAWDDVAADVQTALQALTGLTNVTVTGNYTDGFLVKFIGVNTPLLLVASMDATPLNATITIAESDNVLWSPIIKRGDKIVDSVYGSLAIDEIIEIVDLGGPVMGFRCRCE